jgi:acylphosphatase
MEEHGHNCFHAIVHGRVQGVGFRVFTLQAAQRHNIRGWVRNLPNRCVEVYAEGDDLALTEFLTDLYRGPIMSHVDNIELEWDKKEPAHEQFEIRR